MDHAISPSHQLAQELMQAHESYLKQRNRLELDDQFDVSLIADEFLKLIELQERWFEATQQETN